MNPVNNNILVRYTLSESMMAKLLPINKDGLLNIPIEDIDRFNASETPEKFNPEWDYKTAIKKTVFRTMTMARLYQANLGMIDGITASDIYNFLRCEVIAFDSNIPNLKVGDKVRFLSRPFSSLDFLSTARISEDLTQIELFQNNTFLSMNKNNPVNNNLIVEFMLPITYTDPTSKASRTLDSILSDELITDKINYIRGFNQVNIISDGKVINSSEDGIEIPIGATVQVGNGTGPGHQVHTSQIIDIDIETKRCTYLINKNLILSWYNGR